MSISLINPCLYQIHKRIKAGERVLVTTLTKKSSEDLTDFLKEADIKVAYLHSEVETLDRIEILRSLRIGDIDVVVGINLLREGLDLPEVSLVAILNADKRGFLRSRDALLQTIGRVARNVNGMVIMYGDVMTEAMTQAIEETDRRRAIQVAHNKKHGITPQTIKKKIKDLAEMAPHAKNKKHDTKKVKKEEIGRLITELEADMELASMNLEFEKAAQIYDEITFFKKMQRE
jgi:excinuclease ABC subunit B